MLKIDFNNRILNEDYIEIFKRTSSCEKLKGKTVYVSGASGMIGAYLVGFLIWLNENKHYGITIFAGIRSHEKAMDRFHSFVQEDYFHIICEDVIHPLSDGLQLDYIIHAASLASPQYSKRFPVEIMLPNIIGTYNLLEYAKANPIESFLYISSGGVYGRVSDVPETGITEDMCGVLRYLGPECKYSESKRCGEALCHSYSVEYGIPVKIARLTHTYGPTMDILNDSRVFSEFVSNVINNENIVIKSDGSAIRQFCYIADVIVALIEIIINGENGFPYNVGNDKEVCSIKELATTLVSLYPDKGLNVIYGNGNDDCLRQNTDNNTVFSITRAKTLSWEPIHSLQDGFRRTIEAIEWNNR